MFYAALIGALQIFPHDDDNGYLSSMCVGLTSLHRD